MRSITYTLNVCVLNKYIIITSYTLSKYALINFHFDKFLEHSYLTDPNNYSSN